MLEIVRVPVVRACTRPSRTGVNEVAILPGITRTDPFVVEVLDVQSRMNGVERESREIVGDRA